MKMYTDFIQFEKKIPQGSVFLRIFLYEINLKHIILNQTVYSHQNVGMDLKKILDLVYHYTLVSKNYPFYQTQF